MRHIGFFSLASALICAAVAIVTSAFDTIAGYVFDAISVAFKPDAFNFRDLDPTPRSIFETRRMGLA